jgi:hypothetical protein
MRHDSKNSGSSPLRAQARAGDRPWSFVTGKGVFSTPVIGPDETVYAGSADTYFYAVGRNGKLRWRFKTGEIIDSAAVLGRGGTVTFGSGDEYIYRLRSAKRRLRAAPTERQPVVFQNLARPPELLVSRDRAQPVARNRSGRFRAPVTGRSPHSKRDVPAEGSPALPPDDPRA